MEEVYDKVQGKSYVEKLILCKINEFFQLVVYMPSQFFLGYLKLNSVF